MRSLEAARSRAALETAHVSQELEDCRARVQVLEHELARSREETKRWTRDLEQLQDRLDAAQERLDAASQREAQLQVQLQLKSKRIEEMEHAEQYNLDHIARLEIENQSICQHQHLMDCHERRLVLENEGPRRQTRSATAGAQGIAGERAGAATHGCSAAGGKRGAT
ncbi:hypothetical protein PINS_up002592 [Pythium insidiosum]|nr:hypothetical protein PINS_up002592 [Pythium insidiosum]